MVAADAVLVVRLAATAAPATTPVAAVARVAPAPGPTMFARPAPSPARIVIPSPAVAVVFGTASFGILNTELAAAEHLPIHAVNGVVGIALVHEAHERESTRVPSVEVARDVDIAEVAASLESVAYLFHGAIVGDVVDLESHHAIDVRRAAAAHPSVTERAAHRCDFLCTPILIRQRMPRRKLWRA